VDVKTAAEAISPERAKELLTHWFHQRGARTVAFVQEENPQPDPDARYTVVYEARFKPSVLDQAQVEIWVTHDGEVAIGFETTARIAERLGTKSGRDRFAAGHEPARMSEAGMLALLDLIANGDLAIVAIVVPLLGLTGTEAVLLRGDLDALKSLGYSPTDWIRKPRTRKSIPSRHLLKFQPWH